MFAAAFVVRLAFVTATHSHIYVGPGTFSFGYEMGQVAGSIASGSGFASPCAVPSGPTAWVGPVYPLLIAAVFTVFGMFTSHARLVLLLLNCLFGGLICLTLVAIGSRTLGARAGKAAAWVWVFLPLSVWESRRVWDTTLAALLLSLVFLAIVELHHCPNPVRWLLAGVLAGFAVLTEPSILSFLLLAVAWLCIGNRAKRVYENALLLVVAFLLCVTPWELRNYRVFHRLVPIRSNFGTELQRGNHMEYPLSISYLAVSDLRTHVCSTQAEQDKLRRMGEIAYESSKEREALDFITRHPGLFLAITVRRIAYFWFGYGNTWVDIPHLAGDVPLITAAKRSFLVLLTLLATLGLALSFRDARFGWPLFLLLLLVYPLVYYLTHAEYGYRHPLEPEIVLLAVYPFTRRYPRPDEPAKTARRWDEKQGNREAETAPRR